MLKLDDTNYFRNLLSNNVERIHTASGHNGGLYKLQPGALYMEDELMCNCNISAPMTVWVVVVVFFQHTTLQLTGFEHRDISSGLTS